jgi:predicted transcriptional regulator
MVSFRIDEDDFSRLDTFAQQTSCSRAEVLRRCLRTARLESTVDAQALTEVSRVHADLNRIGGLLKLAIREGVAELRRLINTLSCEGSYITFTSDPCWNL